MCVSPLTFDCNEMIKNDEWTDTKSSSMKKNTVCDEIYILCVVTVICCEADNYWLADYKPTVCWLSGSYLDGCCCSCCNKHVWFQFTVLVHTFILGCVSKVLNKFRMCVCASDMNIFSWKMQMKIESVLKKNTCKQKCPFPTLACAFWFEWISLVCFVVCWFL